ncbi:MAG: NIL domain-containing protein [bacterium]|nr:NIL domain-containing protein [bacterium]
MNKIKIILTFPKETINKPIICHLNTDYKLISNILRAKVMPREVGKMVLEIEGEEKNIEEGIKYLESFGIEVIPVSKEIKFNEEECVSCGACLAVCASGALTLDQESYQVRFDRDLCILCEHCVRACPLRVIEATFDEIER